MNFQNTWLYISFIRLFSGYPAPYEIYTDGSLKRERGAWAYVIVREQKIVHEASGQIKQLGPQKSNNRMEFQAAIEALAWLAPNARATIYSDSRNLVDSMTLWVKAWAFHNWRKKDQRLIADAEHVKKLYTLAQKHQITWKWIRAHAGNVYNERCDELCRSYLDSRRIN